MNRVLAALAKVVGWVIFIAILGGIFLGLVLWYMAAPPPPGP